MDGFFRFDGPFMKLLTKIANMMLVSILWVVACLPVVTVVPACAALFHTTTKVIRGRGNGVIRDYFRSFVDCLRKGWLLSVICILSGLVIYTCLDFGRQMEGTFGTVYFAIGCLLALVWALMVLYIPPVLSRFEGSIGMVLRMALYLPSKRLLPSIGMLVLLAVVAFLTDFYPLFLMFSPGVYADLICTGMEKGLALFMDAEQAQPSETPAQEAAADELSALQLDRQLDGEA